MNNDKNVVIDGSTGKVVNEKKAVSGFTYFKILLFLALGLAISSVVSILGALFLSNIVYGRVDSSTGLIVFITLTVTSFIGCFISSFFVTRNRMKRTKSNAKSIIPFLLYSLFMGFLLSSMVFYVQDPYILGMTFLVTAILLVLLGLIAYLSKGKGLIMFVGVVGLIGAGIGLSYMMTFWLLPLFVGFDTTFLTILFVIECVFLGVFLTYTTFDFFLIKKQINAGMVENSDCVYYSLIIYSDFVHIFVRLIYILILFGRRNN